MATDEINVLKWKPEKDQRKPMVKRWLDRIWQKTKIASAASISLNAPLTFHIDQKLYLFSALDTATIFPD
jgi:hypothetical protein